MLPENSVWIYYIIRFSLGSESGLEPSIAIFCIFFFFLAEKSIKISFQPLHCMLLTMFIYRAYMVVSFVFQKHLKGKDMEFLKQVARTQFNQVRPFRFFVSIPPFIHASNSLLFLFRPSQHYRNIRSGYNAHSKQDKGSSYEIFI